MDAHRACIADVSQALLCGAFAQGERFDNVQVLYIVSKGRGLRGGAQVKPQGSGSYGCTSPKYIYYNIIYILYFTYIYICVFCFNVLYDCIYIYYVSKISKY